MARTNFHTHTTWCDGKASPEAMADEAGRRSFSALGFSSHAMLPGDPLKWPLTTEKLPRYVSEINALREKHALRLRILCGVEADYIRDVSMPERALYNSAAGDGSIDYIIGSVHFVTAPDGALVAVDESPASLAAGIAQHFNGDAAAFIHAYFEQQHEMALGFDFDVIGHPDLVRKFNGRLSYFDETAPWYLEELEKTADAFAVSGKIVEVNTGGIARGWMTDAYPSARFRDMLRSRGVRFILSSDAHSPDGLDCAFDRFDNAEAYVVL